MAKYQNRIISSGEEQLDQKERKRLRSCIASRKYRELHPEKIKEYNKKYYEENKENSSKRFREYYLLNHEAMLERSRVRRKEHPEDKRMASRRRKILLKNSVCELSNKEIKSVMTRCLFCDTTENLTLAHNIPISRGGSTKPDNVFCLCASCNSRMNTKTIDELIESGNLVKLQKSYCWA